MSLRFYKMTGSGNDFIMVDGRVAAPSEWPAERIVAACDRRRGVGADGLVVLTPDDPGSVRMHFFNSDGGRAAMCGNAALCSTRLAVQLGIAEAAGMTLRTDAGDMRTRCVGPGHMAELNLPDVRLPEPAAIEAAPGETGITLTTVGVPHLVVTVDDIEAVDIAGRGRALRFHPALGEPGANANFVAAGGVTGAPWLIRTYERGVEGETLACGTGTVAAALALAAAGRADLPINFVSRGGGPLAVTARLDGDWARDVWLCGEGRLVFTGELNRA